MPLLFMLNCHWAPVQVRTAVRSASRQGPRRLRSLRLPSSRRFFRLLRREVSSVGRFEVHCGCVGSVHCGCPAWRQSWCFLAELAAVASRKGGGQVRPGCFGAGVLLARAVAAQAKTYPVVVFRNNSNRRVRQWTRLSHLYAIGFSPINEANTYKTGEACRFSA